jgi:hypothetical protein
MTSVNLAKRSEGFLVCRLSDVFDMDASSVSALQHSRNIPFAGHFSANAMPDRPSVLSSACGGLATQAQATRGEPICEFLTNSVHVLLG